MLNETASLQEALDRCAKLITAELDAQLAGSPREGEIERPERLLRAMRHAALNGGKRLRPFFVLQIAELFGGSPQSALRTAVALECIHCYSLVHDDLPAMDDDDLRRGNPTVHKAFDEATAILAGDSLQSLAFDILADPRTHPDPAVRCQLVSGMARAAGVGGMAGGQMLDLLAEEQHLDQPLLLRMQAMKTGALFRYACMAGAILAGAADNDIGRMQRFGEAIGAAFQLADDMLDHTATTGDLGKRTGKDQQRGKATMVAQSGLEGARSYADRILHKALAELDPYGPRARLLADAARFILTRKH